MSPSSPPSRPSDPAVSADRPDSRRNQDAPPARRKRKRGPLRRRPNGKWIGGVCTGIAEWLGWDVTLIRIVFVVGSVIPIIPGFVVYAILWLLVPMAKTQASPPSTVDDAGNR